MPIYIPLRPMRVHRNLDNLPVFQNAVISIGSFDGAHRGHQEILGRITEIGRQISGETVIITFDPHPRHVLQPESGEPKLLTTTEEKAEILEGLGIDHLVVIPFNRDFAAQPGEYFIKDFLIKLFKPKFIVIGFDHRFGKDRSGDVELLKQFEKAYHFETILIPEQQVRDITISSTKIRHALEQNQLEKVNELLGRPYSISGKVVSGEKLGRSLGYPTANISLSNPYKLLPAEGIYAVEIHALGMRKKGMLYIGKRPTMEDNTALTIEAYLFDFAGDLYGETIRVDCLKWIRGDAKFDNFEQLAHQIQQDEKQVRDWFAKQDCLCTVAILNYNGRHYLEAYLPSVVETLPSNCSIAVFDNASTDDSVGWLLDAYPDVHLEEFTSNYGFAGGYNRALRSIQSPYCILLNSDVEVTAGWLSNMLDTIESDTRIGALQPKVKWLADRNKFEYAGASGGWMDKMGLPFCRGRIFDVLEEDQGQYDDRTEVFWASGCALMVRTYLFNRIGGFNESYFAHFEEIDLCWRMKRAGFQIVVEPNSVVYHLGGGTLAYGTANKTYLNVRNSLATLLINLERGKIFTTIMKRLVIDGLGGLKFLLTGKWKHVWSIKKGHLHFYSRLRHHLRMRRFYQELVKNVAIGKPNMETGYFNSSIVYAFYIKGKRKFSELNGQS